MFTFVFVIVGALAFISVLGVARRPSEGRTEILLELARPLADALTAKGVLRDEGRGLYWVQDPRRLRAAVGGDVGFRGYLDRELPNLHPAVALALFTESSYRAFELAATDAEVRPPR